MSVTGLGNLAPAFMVSGAVFAGDQSSRAHKLRRGRVTSQVDHFGHDRHRGHGFDATQNLIAGDLTWRTRAGVRLLQL